MKFLLVNLQEMKLREVDFINNAGLHLFNQYRRNWNRNGRNLGHVHSYKPRKKESIRELYSVGSKRQLKHVILKGKC